MTERPLVDELVTQEDRDAAADFLRARGEHEVYCAGVQRGDWDDGDAIQAFARHRIGVLAKVRSLPTEDDVERVARALCLEQGFDAEMVDGPLFRKSSRWKVAEADARVAIAALTQAETVREMAAKAARDALCDMEWPPENGDAQIDAVMAAIRAMPLPGEPK